MAKYVLVRSPVGLVNDGLVGYGWSNIDFSSFGGVAELVDHFHTNGIDYGRKKNQIKRFYNLSKGDVVVAPVGNSIAIGHATDEKSFDSSVLYGENRVAVEFFKDSKGLIVKVPRKSLSQALSSRLKIRMAVAALDEFSDELDGVVEHLKKGGSATLDYRIGAMQEEAEKEFKRLLLENICKGKTYLESGGIGLEKLVLELLKIEGYTGIIKAKNGYSGVADVDIEASKTEPFTSVKLIVQVKHHDGATDAHGLKQLEAIEDDEDSIRCLITTGRVSEGFRERAEVSEIRVLDGSEFVDWLASHIESLSPMTRHRLGIANVPMILG